ncbi:MAG: class II fumarate hydratase [Halieaceae bacterium]|jgi:fumarate hydratase class II|nr:class II fumarate hydratase [Halieaceae bacterium]
MQNGYRREHDALGEIDVPRNALYGAQTQRAVNNFSIAGRPMPRPFIHALARIKGAAAMVNVELGLLDGALGKRIADVATRVSSGALEDQFPVDVYQTGSGTSTNMNMNEVLAHLAGKDVHPNDHVNLCQSSNDVIPSTLQLAAVIESKGELQSALHALEVQLLKRAGEFRDAVKVGRTHLMDAMPITVEQEFMAWASQLAQARRDLESGLEALQTLPLGGTAVGTGVNAHPEFAARVAQRLAQELDLPLCCPTGIRSLGSIDSAVAFSGRLNAVATALSKISEDLRWMNSGPNSGLGEIALPALQPGSSIMPGKVNPVIPEAVLMGCTQVLGLSTAIAIAGRSGNFQLNVMLPLVADNLLQSIQILARSAEALATKAVAGMKVNVEALAERARHNLMLVTALAPHIGYEQCANIAHTAASEGRSILAVAADLTDIAEDRLSAILDPLDLTRRGLPQKPPDQVDADD